MQRTAPFSNIVIVGEEIPPCAGGVAQWGYWLGRKFRERGMGVVYAAPAGCARPQEYYGDAFEVHAVPGDDWRHRKDRRVFHALYRLWRSRRPALVVCLTWKMARVPLALRPFTGWRVAVLAHGMEVTKKRERWRRRVGLRWIFGSADLALAVSRYTRDRVAEFGVDPDRIEVVPCGVDPVRFQPRDGALFRRELGLQGLPVVLTLARLVRRKGHDLAIRALAEVRRRIPNATYLVAGNGESSYLESLRSLARQCGVEDAVRFLGRVEEDDLSGIYSASDVYVMTSRSSPSTGNFEGFGITYLEANACALPVIGSDTGGVADAILDGETGYLIPAEDVPTLTDRLLRLLGDPVLARRMGERGRARVLRDLTWDRIADRFLAALDRRTGGRRPWSAGISRQDSSPVEPLRT